MRRACCFSSVLKWGEIRNCIKIEIRLEETGYGAYHEVYLLKVLSLQYSNNAALGCSSLGIIHIEISNFDLFIILL